MNYEHREISFPSSDGKNTVSAEIYIPKDIPARGIVQLAHGMIDHVGRYRELAEDIVNAGFIFAGHNHLGHGKTAAAPEDFGFFADKGGIDLLVRDMHAMNGILKKEFPGLPLIVFGHSMGSFITRLYVERHSDSMDGAIIHGTAGPLAVLPLGKLLASLVCLFCGKRHRSKLLALLSVGAYRSKFKKQEGVSGWLTRDVTRIVEDDPYRCFNFTASAYRDLFTLLGECNRLDWFKNYPKYMPTLIMSGEADPVGADGKGPRKVYKKLVKAGCKNVVLKLYDGARHELFNEINRDEAISDMIGWLNSVVNK